MSRNCQNLIDHLDHPSQGDDVSVAPTVASAPPSAKTTSDESSAPIADTVKRSNSCIENKYKCTITTDKVNKLRKAVENAVKEHKIFTIKGGWPVIRRELLKRNWIEKIEPQVNKKPPTSSSASTVSNSEELTSNLPAKQDWESHASYVEKCEKTIMSRMLQNYDADFYWNMRRDQSDNFHRCSSYKIMNRFSKSLFASKEGLSLLLLQSYWFTEPGVAAINYPRCYVLGFPDHFNNFVDDFRITACIGLLKWLVNVYDDHGKFGVQSPEGHVSMNAIKFALQRTQEFIENKKHVDIDKEYQRVWDHEWDQFLSNYYLVVHGKTLFRESTDLPLNVCHSKAKNTLSELANFCPEIHADGMKNVWILKPGNKCRGRGIQLIKNIGDVEKVVNMKLKYVIQKYIEKPMLIYNTKFDIRQWFLVASTHPLTIYMYKESYLRFSSQIFSLDNFHESLHLTNHAVQCKYTNVKQRDKALPDDNMWDCHTFQTYLKQIGCQNKWNDTILPGMREGIVCAMLSSQEVMDRRQNTFELYGADFMISEDFKPWLLEINCSPDLSASTSVTSRMCPQCMEDLVKVTVDKRRDPHANTGLFELVYRQNLPRIPPYLGMNLSVRGRKILRTRNKSKSGKETIPSPPLLIPYRKFDPALHPNLYKSVPISEATNRASTAVNNKNLPRIYSPGMYKGPVIEDLIDDLNKTVRRNSAGDGRAGVEFTPTNVQNKNLPTKKPRTKAEKRDNKDKRDNNNKRERVPKTRRICKLKCNNTNNNNFICRKQSAKENIKCEQQAGQEFRRFGLFGKWASQNGIQAEAIGEASAQKDDVVWERETVSILKGKNILNRGEMDGDGDLNANNKSCFRYACFTLDDVGTLLPHITANYTSNSNS